MENATPSNPKTAALLAGTPDEVIERLKKKTIAVPAWEDLKKQYEVKEHRVFTDKAAYPDSVEGDFEKMTRIGLGLQKLAAKRMAELTYGVPVKRIYKAASDKEKEAATVIEKVFQRNRINAVNLQRAKMLFAGCEAFTLWYAVEQANSYYGLPSHAPSPIKLRCKNYSPMEGDGLYPVFDEYGDMLAMAFSSKRKDGDKEIEYFDIYTDTQHVRYVNDGGWSAPVAEAITIGKIPGVYVWRKEPIWEDTTETVHESEMALSRNGNYLRRNAKPILAVFADGEIGPEGEATQEEGPSDDNATRDIVQYPKGSTMQYVTWAQSVDSLKLYLSELRQAFYTQLQLPDFSFDNMKTTPMSGEARKMMFVDAQLKVMDESGPLLEMHDRELNVIKAFVKVILPSHATEIDALEVETIITPFSITDEKEVIQNIMTATGGLPIMSQRQGVESLAWSDDVEKTMAEMQGEAMARAGEPMM